MFTRRHVVSGRWFQTKMMRVDYTDISKTYDTYRSYPVCLMEKIIEYGQIAEGTRMLDVGCGTGNVSAQLLEVMNVDPVGVDISIPMLQKAEESDAFRIRHNEIIVSSLCRGQCPQSADSNCNDALSNSPITSTVSLKHEHDGHWRFSCS